MKKVLIWFLLLSLLSLEPCFALEENQKTVPENEDVKCTNVFRGRAEINENAGNKQEDIFTGDIDTVKTGTQVEMTVSTVLDSGVHQQGDDFFAEVTSDVKDENGNLIIPTGTIAHGQITELKNAKRMGRDGYVTLDFDYLVTPDGREVPIQASMTTKKSKAVSVAKVVAQDTAYTVAGGVIGGIAAVELLGIASAVASNGYTVAGGAGIGAVAGLGYSLARSGKEVLISPGDEIVVKFDNSIELPVLKEEAFKEKEEALDGLNIQIKNCSLSKDPFGEENMITLTLDVDNETDKTFSSFDIALVNDYKAVFYPSPFGNTGMWFKKIDPKSRALGQITFSVDNPKRKHWLVFYDNITRKPLAKISVDNAKKQIEKEKIAKAKEKKKKRREE